ncbi:hypothetical protein EVAR_96200_1 [Eumeta japonica]|uniref:Uncharacterized protein n=1 Tax=Eumeta variegata TaxID=151549 RepID=A0A4C1VHK8_EUMVA|nr:hypothetical protein EVAR_96200_1 [Eumeta japonica]
MYNEQYSTTELLSPRCGARAWAAPGAGAASWQCLVKQHLNFVSRTTFPFCQNLSFWCQIQTSFRAKLQGIRSRLVDLYQVSLSDIFHHAANWASSNTDSPHAVAFGVLLTTEMYNETVKRAPALFAR